MAYECEDSDYICMDSALGFVFSAQSAVPMGCYSTHILLSEGTTIVSLTAGNQQDIGEEKGRSLIQSLQKSITSMTSMNIWPTFNCALATMIHAIEKINLNVTFQSNVSTGTFIKKSVLILVYSSYITRNTNSF